MSCTILTSLVNSQFLQDRVYNIGIPQEQLEGLEIPTESQPVTSVQYHDRPRRKMRPLDVIMLGYRIKPKTSAKINVTKYNIQLHRVSYRAAIPLHAQSVRVWC